MTTRNGSGYARYSCALLLLACVLVVSTVDALLLEASQTFFTAGFNGVYIQGPGALLAFALLSAVADACLVVGLWALALAWLSRRRWTVMQKLASAALFSLTVPLGIDFVFYQVGAVLGRMASIPILWEVSGGGFQLMLSQAALHAVPLAIVLACAGLAGAGAVWGIGRLQRATGWGSDATVPTPRRLWLGFGALLVGAVVAIVSADRIEPRLSVGLGPKPSVRLLTGVVRLVTDIDRDGFGLLSRPRDPAPFDGSRHAFALDVRANGVDENGFAGDLPADVRAPATVVPEGIDAAGQRRPDVLVIYLESFRADRLGRSRNGHEITPFFNELAREGASSERAFVHSPYTIWSRAQLFGGRIDPYDGQDTWIDDFKALGYTVAHFSGQDDSFGDSVALLGLDRVDHFYDARQDADRRTSRGNSAGSLQISWKVLLERVDAYLTDYSQEQARNPTGTPLFLYVNLVDTHFPYTHEELDDLLGVSPLSRYDIKAKNAEGVRATYDNTAANVDLAARRIVERFREATGGRDHAILVTSDHGQALFENDLLGHGQSLTADQTRAPFILWGVGGDWPEPLGIADVRGLLQRNLFEVPALEEKGSTPPRARFNLDPSRAVFHFMAQIRHPHIIGLRSAGGLVSYHLDREALDLYGPDDAQREVPAEDRRRAFDELIWSWESLREQVDGDAERRDERSRKRPGAA